MIDIDFDEVENIKKIKELSVVLYPDSFFYGLWDNNETLVKSDRHSMVNFKKLINILNKTYDFKITRVMSTIKPYVHLPREDYEKKYYEDYFDGVYNVSKRQSSKKDIDDFLREEITTLHYMDKKVMKVMQSTNAPFKTAHISTALASYSFLADAELTCFIEESKLHICYAKDGKFQLYNQYYCEKAEDYLYYILLVMENFNIHPHENTVHIGGHINVDSPLMKMLSAYIKDIVLADSNIVIHEKQKIPAQYYFELYLCKSCV